MYVVLSLSTVVALFNAISQARVDAEPEPAGETDGKPNKKSKAKAILAADKKSKIKSLTKDLFANSMKSDLSTAGKTDGEKTAAGSTTTTSGNGQWSALRDDYMLDKGMKLKVRCFILQVSVLCISMIRLSAYLFVDIRTGTRTMILYRQTMVIYKYDTCKLATKDDGPVQ